MPENQSYTNILLVEDSPSLAAVYRAYLDNDQYQVQHAADGAQAIKSLQQEVPDLVLLDLMLPDIPGMDVLKHIHQQALDCSVIIITAHGSVDLAIESMRLGAADFLSKPFDAARLKVTVANTLEKRSLSRMVSRYQETYERDRFHNFIGGSLSMQAVYRIIESAAPSKATVFITGESGTGKELCAEAIHQESPRHDQAFVALNCAAIPRDLMESEIFGHIKGAFTGAVSNREGAANRADGGTLFLDEVCEMDLDLQSKLLRFIQTGRFQKVGDSREQQVDIRFVCATNRDPLAEVQAGRFREDLYYRLNVIPIAMPPLRERDDDILMIANHMLVRMAQEEEKPFKGFSESAEIRLRQYDWPGNVRQLENVMRNIIVLNNAEIISADMLPVQLESPPAEPQSSSTVNTQSERQTAADPAPIRSQVDTRPISDEIRPLWIEEKAVIERAIDLCDGNIPRAAAQLDISASTIYRKKTQWEKNQVND